MKVVDTEIGRLLNVTTTTTTTNNILPPPTTATTATAPRTLTLTAESLTPASLAILLQRAWAVGSRMSSLGVRLSSGVMYLISPSALWTPSCVVVVVAVVAVPIVIDFDAQGDGGSIVRWIDMPCG